MTRRKSWHTRARVCARSRPRPRQRRAVSRERSMPNPASRSRRRESSARSSAWPSAVRIRGHPPPWLHRRRRGAAHPPCRGPRHSRRHAPHLRGNRPGRATMAPAPCASPWCQPTLAGLALTTAREVGVGTPRLERSALRAAGPSPGSSKPPRSPSRLRVIAERTAALESARATAARACSARRGAHRSSRGGRYSAPWSA